MTDTPAPEAVERLAQQGHAVLGPHDDMPECVQRNLMVYVNMWQFRETLEAMTALLARVDALTKERDFEQGSRLTSESQLGVEIDRLMRERDAAIRDRDKTQEAFAAANELLAEECRLKSLALAASGAVAEAMRGWIEKLNGPHEWGYRDPVEGGFIHDMAPFFVAERLAAILARKEDTDHDHR